MPGDIKLLLEFTRAMARAATLEDMLQAIVEKTAAVVGVQRVSIRLFDPTHTRLLATARSGKALHQNATGEYKLGEGLIGWIAEHVQPLRSNDAEEDPRFVPRPDMVDRMGSFVGAPIVVDKVCIGVISAVAAEKGHFTEEHQDLLELVAEICAPRLEVARLSRLAQVDALTGAFNRRGLEVAFPEARTCSVMMVDIDHFKKINDQLGHAAGDECLKRVAQLLSGVLRSEDSVIRYGGEEFLLVLPGIDLNTALRIGERARAAVEATTVRLARVDVQLTISLGVAFRRPGEMRDETIARADAALYNAKQMGRNRVVAA